MPSSALARVAMLVLGGPIVMFWQVIPPAPSPVSAIAIAVASDVHWA